MAKDTTTVIQQNFSFGAPMNKTEIILFYLWQIRLTDYR